MLLHGTTSHGAERIRDDNGHPVRGRPEPLTYYYSGGPLAQTIRAMRAEKGSLNSVAVVGLGTGSLVCYKQPGEHWTYYEIDPVVARIARDPSKFRFLSDCAPDTDVVLGDARLTLADSRHKFDLIVLDAFSSDVVPVHLLTTEALDVYLGKLKPGGAIAFHISNRYMELGSVVSADAASKGLVAYLKRDRSVTVADFKRNMYASSLVAVVARKDQDLAALSGEGGWIRQSAPAGVRPWTDDYSNILAAMWRMYRRH